MHARKRSGGQAAKMQPIRFTDYTLFGFWRSLPGIETMAPRLESRAD
jgi:hypothetical protein